MTTASVATSVFPPGEATSETAVGEDPTAFERQQKAWHQKAQARVNPDRMASAIIALVLVLTVMAASFIFSFTAIYEAAAWTGQDQWVWVFAPIYIDGAIFAYTIARTLGRWRGEKALWSLFFLLLYTSLSVVVNFAHTASFWEWNLTTPESWVGLAIACGAPIAALGTAEQIIHLVFKKPGEKKKGWLRRLFDRFNDPESDRTHPENKRVHEYEGADAAQAVPHAVPDVTVPVPASVESVPTSSPVEADSVLTEPETDVVAPPTGSLVISAEDAAPTPQTAAERAPDPEDLDTFEALFGASPKPKEQDA